MSGSEESWLPKTRDDWVGMFADGFALDRARKEEADAKRAAEEDANKDKGKTDDSGSTKRTLAERLLGS